MIPYFCRYFYLICFATYALQEGPGGFANTFTQFMDGHSELREMIEEVEAVMVAGRKKAYKVCTMIYFRYSTLIYSRY